MNIELLNYFGNDLMVVNAARVSYGKTKSILDTSDQGLINYLVKHGHTSPFRHPQLQFRIQCPIFVERQLFKHQVGLTANSISGRYVDFSDTYHFPKELRAQSADSKQGSSGIIHDPSLIKEMEEHIIRSQELYRKLCEAGVAKEQSRIILPLALETQFIWTGSLLAFIHFFNLRLEAHAQQETREVARAMLDKIAGLEEAPFKFSLAAFKLMDCA